MITNSIGSRSTSPTSSKQKKALARAYLIKTMVAHVKDEVPTELLRQMVLELADRGREQERTGWLVGDDKFDLANAVKAAKGARLNQILVAALLAGTTSAYADDSKTRKALVEYARVLKVKTPEAFLSKEDERIGNVKACRGVAVRKNRPAGTGTATSISAARGLRMIYAATRCA